MKLDLSDIIDVPGSKKDFSFEMDAGQYDFSGVEEFTSPVIFAGRVENHAGALTLSGEIKGEMRCQCARCLREFMRPLLMPVEAYLAEELQDEELEDTWLIEGDEADLGEIADTALVLNMDSRFLCSEDCKGLCPRCGRNLNYGPCDCGEDQDPRLAVLAQLLENNQKD